MVAQGVAFSLYSIGMPLFDAQVKKGKVIRNQGASCQLCFKKRQTMNAEGAVSSATTEWSKNCERIRKDCEQLARDEAAKIANRKAKSMGPRDTLNFMF